jgi:hypothetical protein
MAEFLQDAVRTSKLYGTISLSYSRCMQIMSVDGDGDGAEKLGDINSWE